MKLLPIQSCMSEACQRLSLCRTRHMLGCSCSSSNTLVRSLMAAKPGYSPQLGLHTIMKPGKQRVGAGLALDKFAKAKISKYDKRKVIEKQRALKAKQYKKYQRLQKRLDGAPPQAVGVLGMPEGQLQYTIADAAEDRQQHDAHSSEDAHSSQDEQQQHHHQDDRQQQQQQRHACNRQLQHEQQEDMPHKHRKHGRKPPSQLQRLAEKTVAEKAAREQERLQHEAALAERNKQLEAKKKHRSHQKHDFFRRTKHGQPVMKYRVDKILEQLQNEKRH